MPRAHLLASERSFPRLRPASHSSIRKTQLRSSSAFQPTVARLKGDELSEIIEGQAHMPSPYARVWDPTQERIRVYRFKPPAKELYGPEAGVRLAKQTIAQVDGEIATLRSGELAGGSLDWMRDGTFVFAGGSRGMLLYTLKLAIDHVGRNGFIAVAVADKTEKAAASGQVQRAELSYWVVKELERYAREEKGVPIYVTNDGLRLGNSAKPEENLPHTLLMEALQTNLNGRSVRGFFDGIAAALPATILGQKRILAPGIYTDPEICAPRAIQWLLPVLPESVNTGNIFMMSTLPHGFADQLAERFGLEFQVHYGWNGAHRMETKDPDHEFFGEEAGYDGTLWQSKVESKKRIAEVNAAGQRPAFLVDLPTMFSEAIKHIQGAWLRAMLLRHGMREQGLLIREIPRLGVEAPILLGQQLQARAVGAAWEHHIHLEQEEVAARDRSRELVLSLRDRPDDVAYFRSLGLGDYA